MATKDKADKMASDVAHMKELMKKKDDLEAEIKEFQDILDSQDGVGMSGPLVDAEGYPRSDIDVYTVRHARNKVICLQNDHKDLMKSIEQCLYKIHADARDHSNEELQTTSFPKPAAKSTSSEKKPFAKVDRVDAGSPSAVAGLEVNDLLIEFGSITAENFQNLQNIGKVVQHSAGRSLPVSVIRDEKEVRLSLTPQTWNGRGLLGCNILPLGR
ncbi:26S proteasome non-ATPase regulatory subunit 9-like [Liolophura sinensis]|uniref:26S proteasome non-ATPase regulatory subunit 9-like n=1 Tax=Liolophura sinensis TaxID=3198878 RepID=UPI00315909C9